MQHVQNFRYEHRILSDPGEGPKVRQRRKGIKHEVYATTVFVQRAIYVSDSSETTRLAYD